MCNDLTKLKQEIVWLREVDEKKKKKSLKHLDTAYQNFFTLHAGYPKYKSKKTHQYSYATGYVNKNIQYLGKHIRLPKLGNIKIRDKQVPQGRILNATVSQESDGKYYVSLCCTDVEISIMPKTTNAIGIDLGLTDFAIMSNGDKISNYNFYERSEKKLMKLQRALSRKQIGSHRWNQNRIKIAKLQKHIRNQRRDFLQKLTTTLVSNYDTICMESLNITQMKETDSSLRNKRVEDVSWSEFIRELQYKCNWYGKQLVKIDTYFPSSQICHVCGVNSGKKDVSIRKWICPSCNSVLDRDINAAINIYNEGLRKINIC